MSPPPSVRGDHAYEGDVLRGPGADGCECDADHDGGDGERQDVRDALDHLKDRVTDRPLLLGGFSFGSVVGLSVARDDSELSGLIGMGLPVTLADVSFLNDEQRPLLLLQGENDQFGPIGQLKEVLDTTRKNVDLRVIEGTEHLFNGKFDVLQEEIRDYFQQAPGKEYLE
ncbi:MAG: alpha/beta hydrolase [bacterium]